MGKMKFIISIKNARRAAIATVASVAMVCIGFANTATAQFQTQPPTGPAFAPPTATSNPDQAFPEGAASPTGIAAPATNLEPSAQDAAATEAAIPTKNLLNVLWEGGPMMIPIAICSFILFVFVFERTISLRRGRVIPRPFVKRFLQQLRDGQLDKEKALELCDKNRSPVAEVFAAAVRKWGKSSVEVEQAVIDTGERVSNELRRYLRLLNGVSNISPLLGLLGTVLGMISAFNAIATTAAIGRPDLLAAGISQALLTTAAGLSVAIPALIAWLFFVGKVDRLIMDIDAHAQSVVAVIASDGWDRDGAASRRTSSKSAERDESGSSSTKSSSSKRRAKAA
jgi:biopolymer transport protein ExbB